MAIENINKLTTLGNLDTYNSMLNARIGKTIDFSCPLYDSGESSAETYQTILELQPGQSYKFEVFSKTSGTDEAFEVGVNLYKSPAVGYCTGKASFGIATVDDKTYLVANSGVRITYYIKVVVDSAYSTSWEHSCKAIEYSDLKWIATENVNVFTNNISASDVSYDNTTSKSTAINVQDALDDLYENKRNIATAGGLETSGLECHYFGVNYSKGVKGSVGQYVPLYKITSHDNGKAQLSFEVISREDICGYYGRYILATRSGQPPRFMCVDFANHSKYDDVFNTNSIVVVKESESVYTIYKRIETTEYDFFVTSETFRDTLYCDIQCYHGQTFDGPDKFGAIKATAETLSEASVIAPSIVATGTVVTITDDNWSQYLDKSPYDGGRFWNESGWIVPSDTSVIRFETTDTKNVATLLGTNYQPFENGHRIAITGNYVIHNGDGYDGDANFSRYYYQHVRLNNGEKNYKGELTNLNSNEYSYGNHSMEAFEDFLWWNGTWYDRGYIGAGGGSQLEPSTDSITVDEDGHLTSIQSGDVVSVSTANSLIYQINTLVDRIKTLEEYVYWEEYERPNVTSLSITGPESITEAGKYTYTVIVDPEDAKSDIEMDLNKL